MFLEKNKEILDTELWVIVDGLKMAKITLNDHSILITIFSDLREALTVI